MFFYLASACSGNFDGIPIGHRTSWFSERFWPADTVLAGILVAQVLCASVDSNLATFCPNASAFALGYLSNPAAKELVSEHLAWKKTSLLLISFGTS